MMTDKLPQYVEIETSRFCNRTCAWCPNGTSGLRTTQELMSWDLFNRILEEFAALHYTGWIALHNYNEPLANPRLLEELVCLRRYLPGSRLSIFTNGDLLNLDRLNSLQRVGVAYLRVSLYPALRRVSEPVNADVIHTWLLRKGFDTITAWSFGEVRQGLAARGMVDAMEIEVIRPDVSRYNWRGGTVDTLAGPPRTSPCYMTQHSASIDYKGNLKMCCNVYTGYTAHEPYLIGNLAESSFISLWTSDKMRVLRIAHEAADWSLSPICKRCTQHLPPAQVAQLHDMERRARA